LIPLALVAAAATSTAAIETSVVLFPTYAKPLASGPSVLDRNRLTLFTQELHTFARERFLDRGWLVAPAEDVRRAIGARGGRASCLDARCYADVSRKVGATHWLAARLVEGNDQRCAASVVLESLSDGRRLARIERSLRPCTADNLLVTAREIGLEIGAGPKVPVHVTLDLTDLEVGTAPDLPDIPDVEVLATATATRARGKLGLDRALAIYERRHLILFDHDTGEDVLTLVAQNGALVGECAIRTSAKLPIDRELEKFCEGNNWEWAWLGVPVGGIVAAGSVRGLQEGTAPGVLGFVFGAIAAAVSATLALILNADAADPEDGEYWSHPIELEAMVAEANARLRSRLELSAAEVEAAGMRR
jgi:hypothetical protein